MASNIKLRVRQRPVIGQSTHCTSFGTAKLLTLQNFNLPFSLYKALQNCPLDCPRNEFLRKRYMECISTLKNVKTIPPEYYTILFKILLYMEDYELKVIAARHNLTNQKLREVSDKFVITVNTLDEDDPFVMIGDTVILQNTNSKQNYFCKIVDIEGKNIFLALFKPDYRKKLLNCTVNVNFSTSRWPIKCLHYVLHIIHEHHLVQSIYPKINTNHYKAPQDNLNWIHTNVAENPEQKQAVINILNNSAYPAPYILFGPPGTGKTTTLVEAICQIRNQYKCKHILVCSSSNAAADEIAKRLLTKLPCKDVFRMYAPSKRWEDLDKDISPSSNFVDNVVLFLPKEIFILKKIVITTLVTCTRLAKLNLLPDHFSYIFIDEASQSMELVSLIPFTLCSSNKTKGTLHAQIVIAGDPHQLGPIVRCKLIEHLLGKSLLERLMECEPYQKVENKYNPRYITKLIRNYRSQEPIFHVPNHLFYENELLCYSKSDIKKLALNWPIMLNKTFPILFLGVKGEEVRVPNKSIYNINEISVVVHCIRTLMRTKFGAHKIQGKDIGVVTPFKQQRIMIEKDLNKYRLNGVTVGTVETFQGQEREIMILTTVRSKSFEHEGKEHIGFLSNPRRFNVAVTRARTFLLIIGNPPILCKSEFWKALWDYCVENNAYSIIPE
ncbi:putative helicase mov-10-B.1 [Calliopsis andreniformis]|uniref:putative helicase mov-10-B.1 n=1 Tax=Calliopsis andreniformis TaxID=337506 RepID=UPI003FCE2D11